MPATLFGNEVTALMHPVDVPALETLGFLECHLLFPGARLLEVGCGQGALAAALAARGVQVRAIDSLPEAVAEARARGVDAARADVLDYEDDPFDIVLFSRSLHHIHSPSQATEKAYHLLKVGGFLLVEDFSPDRVDSRTAAWRYEVELLLHAAGLLGDYTPSYDFSIDPLARWQEEHFGEHAVATSDEMNRAVIQQFQTALREDAPYLYRYLVEKFEPGERGFRVAQHLLAWEKHLIATGEIQPVGLRLAARRNP